jgi:hypothetical protein
MKYSTSRRLFLAKSALLTTGLALIPSSTLTANSKECPFEGYNPYADFKSDIRKQFFGKELEVSGVLYNKDGSPVPYAVLEIWHLSPESKKFRHRTKVRTNENGEYKLITDFPAREEAQSARVYFKISNNNKSRYSELVVSEFGGYITSTHWQENRELGDKLFPTSDKFLNKTSINFNISI